MELGIPGDGGGNIRKIRGGRAHHGNGCNNAVVLEHTLVHVVHDTRLVDDPGIHEGISLPPGRVMHLSWVSLHVVVMKRILARASDAFVLDFSRWCSRETDFSYLSRICSFMDCRRFFVIFSLCIGATTIVCMFCETRAKIICGVTCSGSYSSFRAISVAYFRLASSYGAPLGRTRVMVSTTSGSI